MSVAPKGLCGALDEGELCRLGSVSWHRRFRAGEAIHVEGEVPPSFCAIVSGVVKLLKSLPNGSQQIVGLFAAGDFLGRPFGGEARATAIAASEVEICWFPRATIESLAASSGAVKDWLYRARLRRAREGAGMDHAARPHDGGAEDGRIPPIGDASNRRRQGGAGSARETAIELPLSRTEIADYLGLTIETVSRQIARLRERHVISAGNTRSVVVHRPDVLTAIVDSAQAASHASFARVDA